MATIRKISGYIFVSFMGVAITGALFCLFYFMFFLPHESRWYYTTYETSERYSFEYVREITEKDMPVIHEIRVDEVGFIQVDDTTYNEWYKDFNTITVTVYRLKAKQMRRIGLGNDVDEYTEVRKTKYAFPYETGVIPYTEDDLHAALLNNEDHYSVTPKAKAGSYEKFEKEYPEYKLLQ